MSFEYYAKCIKCKKIYTSLNFENKCPNCGDICEWIAKRYFSPVQVMNKFEVEEDGLYKMSYIDDKTRSKELILPRKSFEEMLIKWRLEKKEMSSDE